MRKNLAAVAAQLVRAEKYFSGGRYQEPSNVIDKLLPGLSILLGNSADKDSLLENLDSLSSKVGKCVAYRKGIVRLLLPL